MKRAQRSFHVWRLETLCYKATAESFTCFPYSLVNLLRTIANLVVCPINLNISPLYNFRKGGVDVSPNSLSLNRSTFISLIMLIGAKHSQDPLSSSVLEG